MFQEHSNLTAVKYLSLLVIWFQEFQRCFCQMISSKDILRCIISSVCEDLELKTDHWRGFAIGSGPSFKSSSPGSYFMTFEALTCQQRWKVTVDSRYWQYSVGLLRITQTLEWIFKLTLLPSLLFSPQIWENAPLTIKCWDNIYFIYFFFLLTRSSGLDWRDNI